MAVVVENDILLGGRYRLDELIGTGGMGRVYRGLHTGIRRPVAIKIVEPEHGRRIEAIARFQVEAFASGQLDHPNIIAVSDFGTLDDGSMFLVMEVLDGESLAARLARETRLAWPIAIEIMRGLLAGLQYAHDREIVHCDLKPDNLFLAHKHGSDVVKLLDFGIARVCAAPDDGPDGMTIGTPTYLSPEQAVGAAITAASDLYSASVVLYEMLVGYPPFTDVHAAERLAAHVTREPPPLDPALGIPPALAALVMTGLAKSPSARFGSATELQERLDDVLRAEGLAPPAPVRTRLQTNGVGLLPRAATEPPVRATTEPPVDLGGGVQRARSEPPRVTLLTRRARMGRWALAGGLALGLGGVALSATSRGSSPTVVQVTAPAIVAVQPVAPAPVVTAPLAMTTLPSAAHVSAVVAGTHAAGATDLARVRWLVGQIDLAIAERRFVAPAGHNALEHLIELRRLDPTNDAVARLGTEVASVLAREATAHPEQSATLLAAAKQITTPARPAAPVAAAVPPPAAVADEHARDPALAGKRIAEGAAALGGGHYDDAETAYKRALAADHTNSAALAGLAEVAFQRGDYARSALSARAAVTMAPRSSTNRMLLAKAYYKLMRYDDAIAQWQAVLSVDPSNPVAKQHIALARSAAGR